MKTALRALIIEDMEDDCLLLIRELRRGGYDVTFKRVDTLAAVEQVLDHQQWDVVISDYKLPEFTALAVLKLMQARKLDLPFILISGTINEDDAVEALRAGAHDFFTKDKLSRLLPAIERELRDARERQQRRTAEKALQESEQKFRSIVEQSADGIILTDGDGKILEWNVAQERITGLMRAETIGQNLWDVLFRLSVDGSRTPEQYQALRTATQRSYRSAQLVELAQAAESIIQRPDGERRIIQTSTFPIQSGNTTMVGSVVRDVTEHRQAEHELRKLYRAVEQSANAVAITDFNGKVEYLNRRYPELTGFSASEIIGQLAPMLRPGTLPADQRKSIWQTIRSGNEWKGEILNHRKNGEVYWETVSISPIRDSLGAITHFLMIKEDITERKRAEQETLRLNQELQQRNRQLLALHEIGRTLAATLDVRTIYRVMYSEVAQNVLHAPHFVVALLDEEAQLIRCVYAMIDGEEIDPGQLPPYPLGEGPTSHALRTQETRVVNLDAIRPSLEARGRLVHIGDSRQPRTALYVPLISRDKAIGVLNFQHYEPDAFSQTDITFVTTLASQAAVALENARLYATVRNHAEELSALYNATSFLFRSDNVFDLGNQIVQAVAREFQQADCGLLLVDKEQGQMVRMARSGEYVEIPDAELRLDGPGLAAEAVCTGRAIYVPNGALHSDSITSAGHTRARLIVPLRTSSGILGVLDVQSVKPHAFSQRDQRILTAFAERVAVALENGQLYERLNQYAAELESRVVQRTTELHRAKERVEAILNHSNDGIILIDASYRCQQANPAFNGLFGYAPDEIFRQSIIELAETSYRSILVNALRRVFDAREPQRIEIVALRKDGARFDVDVVLAPIVEYDTRTFSAICSWRDITERKQMENNLRQALEKEKELNELKTRFVSMVSHEFRTPLTVIQTSAGLLDRYSNRLTEEKKSEQLGKIRAQIKRLTEMLDDILTLSRAETVGLEFAPVETDLVEFCRDIISDIAFTDKAHNIRFAVVRNSPKAFIDSKLMRQAIMNLLSNAIKYSPPGTTIHVGLFGGKQAAMIQIRDEGIGIPEEDQKHLFDLFHRARNVGNIVGTGLGLAIVKRAVQAHSGRITFDSKVGVGTTFTVTIPIRQNGD